MNRYFMSQSSAAIIPVCRLKLLQLCCRFSKFFNLVIVAATSFFLILLSNDAALAGDFFDPKLWLQQLRTADRVVLMIVPVGSDFPIALNPADLGSVSCQYAIEPGPVFEELLDVLDSNIVEYMTGPMRTGVRIGIVFETDGRVVQEFYFNDRGGPGKLVGLSGDRLVTLKAGIPSELRALVIRPNVVLIKDHHSRCPHP
jgi:hypothetical protein